MINNQLHTRQRQRRHSLTSDRQSNRYAIMHCTVCSAVNSGVQSTCSCNDW